MHSYQQCGPTHTNRRIFIRFINISFQTMASCLYSQDSLWKTSCYFILMKLDFSTFSFIGCTFDILSKEYFFSITKIFYYFWINIRVCDFSFERGTWCRSKALLWCGDLVFPVSFVEGSELYHEIAFALGCYLWATKNVGLLQCYLCVNVYVYICQCKTDFITVSLW